MVLYIGKKEEYIVERLRNEGRHGIIKQLTNDKWEYKIEVYDALERAMLHFSDFKKITEKIEERKYKMEIYYEAIDETEVLIRVLSFGPMLRVIYPKRFISLIKERLKKQKKLWTF